MSKKIDATGMPLPIEALRVLKQRGIYVRPLVTLEHQNLASRYVVRGVESGGAAGDVGHYVTFAAENGLPVEYLHPVESIAVNGIHAIVVATSLVRLEMLRKSRTYELLITRHAPDKAEKARRPALDAKLLFRGRHGRLELDLADRDRDQSGLVAPRFYSPSGEAIAIPEHLLAAVCAVTAAVNCLGCSHSHYVQAPGAAAANTSRVGIRLAAESLAS